MKVKDFWSFIKANETLDKLYAKSVGNHLTYETSKYPDSTRKLHEMREVLRKQRYVSFIN